MFRVFVSAAILAAYALAQTSGIVIKTETDLREFATLVNNGNDFTVSTITLENDINLEDGEWTPVGTLANPFKGVFEGNGFVIGGVFINDEKKDNVGLFGYSTGTIKNLGVIVNINAGNNVGGLVGRNSGEKGIIENCFVSGVVKGNKYVGGLAGRNWGGSVKNSYAMVNVEGKEFGTGGLVGSNDLGGVINNSYAVGDVKGNNSPYSYVGKLVGACYIDTVESSYALKENVADKFVGYKEQSTICQNSGLKTEVQMKQQGTFFNWDFNDIWGIDANINNGYPYLRGVGNDYKGGNTPIHDNIKKSDKKHGILLKENIVSDKVEMRIVLPDNDKVLEVKVAIYDNVGNVVFEASGKNTETFVWDLKNGAGRNVANGSYLIVAGARGAKGNYAYFAKVGVKR